MYIYNQKRISPIEFFLAQFKNSQLFINLFEHLRIIYYIQYLNFGLLKVWKMFYIVNIVYFVLKLYYYKLVRLTPLTRRIRFKKKKIIINSLKYKWRKFVLCRNRKYSYIKSRLFYRRRILRSYTRKFYRNNFTFRLFYRRRIFRLYYYNYKRFRRYQNLRFYKRPRNLRHQRRYFRLLSEYNFRINSTGLNLDIGVNWPLFLIKIINNFQIKLYLIKSIYAALITKNEINKMQLQISMIRTKYLIYKPFYFDFLLTILVICNYALSTYFLILLTWHLQKQFKHRKHIWLILTLLKNFYFLKPQIIGIKLLMKGPFDKHGRTRTFFKQIGLIRSFTNYNFQFVYDKISCIGIYGIFNIKFWILYA